MSEITFEGLVHEGESLLEHSPEIANFIDSTLQKIRDMAGFNDGDGETLPFLTQDIAAVIANIGATIEEVLKPLLSQTIEQQKEAVRALYAFVVSKTHKNMFGDELLFESE